MPEDEAEERALDSLEDEIMRETAIDPPASATARLEMISALRRSPAARRGAGLAAAGLIVFGGVVLARNGGDENPSEGGTTSTQSDPSGADISVEDAVGDWEEFAGLEKIKPERTADGVNAGEAMAAADLVGFDASSSGGSTELNLRFAGDAQGVQAFTRGDLGGGAEIKFPDGTRREIIFRDDGSVKMVSAPSGVKVTMEWVGPDHLRLIIDGMALEPGATIEARVSLSIFDGTAQDVAGP